eukprot:CAMPEP_0185766524 /NCGR_PEP_ID=MMETSP1174-20130828/38104_1 /TAXON_ID=35687 /ORGANISM="Dictyocha speculum, Strain CCMP1381" /LENGTH=57 /DNA_ID=CAMNT_0028450257 /DNA_START=79 /DNA_END=249 /DNA_ORIENTATION=+
MGAAEEARAEALVEGKDPFVPQHADRRVPDAGVKLTAAFLGLMLHMLRDESGADHPQ